HRKKSKKQSQASGAMALPPPESTTWQASPLTSNAQALPQQPMLPTSEVNETGKKKKKKSRQHSMGNEPQMTQGQQGHGQQMVPWPAGSPVPLRPQMPTATWQQSPMVQQTMPIAQWQPAPQAVQ